MILLEIKKFLKERQHASLFELCENFDSSRDAMRAMLAFLIDRGQVEQASKNSACGISCSKCAVETIEIYEWTARKLNVS